MGMLNLKLDCVVNLLCEVSIRYISEIWLVTVHQYLACVRWYAHLTFVATLLLALTVRRIVISPLPLMIGIPFLLLPHPVMSCPLAAVNYAPNYRGPPMCPACQNAIPFEDCVQ
jgi:hypothetical protein